nr:unnamed protein product [Callosobruchus chinensis]
MTYSEQTMKVS